jgi:hypothetical protein
MLTPEEQKIMAEAGTSAAEFLKTATDEEIDAEIVKLLTPLALLGLTLVARDRGWTESQRLKAITYTALRLGQAKSQLLKLRKSN